MVRTKRWGRAVVLVGLVGGAGSAWAEDCSEAARLYQASQSLSGDREAALLGKALTLCPRHAGALNNLALVRERAGRPADAEVLYRRAIRADPAAIEPFAGLGDVLMAQGLHGDAASAYATFLARLRAKKRAGTAGALAAHEGRYAERLERAQQGSPIVSEETITRALRGIGVRVEHGVGGGGAVSAPETPPKVWQSRPSIDVSIYFAFGSAELSSVSDAQLSVIARALGHAQLSKARVRIDGHTDSVGSDAFNRGLSKRRAEAVRRALIATGTDGRRLSALGHGESRPVASNDTVAGRATNRRVTLVNLTGEVR